VNAHACKEVDGQEEDDPQVDGQEEHGSQEHGP
jgi:hypothetical protein